MRNWCIKSLLYLSGTSSKDQLDKKEREKESGIRTKELVKFRSNLLVQFKGIFRISATSSKDHFDKGNRRTSSNSI